ncbi:MAG TPA: hypothetical protein VHM69_20100 [Rubrobacter sp.]|nr:hypothetical protein [Rubrobacter sp.]
MKPAKKVRPDAIERPDVELTADVKARELRFDKVPETEIRFPGYSDDETISGTVRENLPEEVEAGVTYRDARVRLRSAAQLPIPESGALRRKSGKE